MILSHYPKGKRGPPTIGIEKMLRVYFLQQWYGLVEEALKTTISDRKSICGFAGIDLGHSGVPDATTLLNFSHLLEADALTLRILEEVNAHLSAHGLLMR